MVDTLKIYMENRVRYLQEELDEHKNAVKMYEQKFEYHKAEVIQIQNQIDEIEKLGF